MLFIEVYLILLSFGGFFCNLLYSYTFLYCIDLYSVVLYCKAVGKVLEHSNTRVAIDSERAINCLLGTRRGGMAGYAIAGMCSAIYK